MSKPMDIKVMRFILILTVMALVFHLPDLASAQSGGRIVRIQDGTNSRCIDPSTDSLWLSIRRVITQRDTGWFSDDTSTVILAKAAVIAHPDPGKPIVYPLMSEVGVAAYDEGQVSLPVEYGVVDRLELNQIDHQYTGLSVELTLLNIRDRTPLGNALSALRTVASKLPASPVGQAAGYLIDFANSAVDRDVEDHDADDKAVSATLRLSFAPNGQCAGDGSDAFESTGTIAVIQSTGIPGDGLVPVGDAGGRYCWRANTVYTFDLEAAPERGGVPCDDPSYEYRPVTNDYVGFILNAMPANFDRLSASGQRPYAAEAYARCDAHRIPGDECLP